MIRSDFCRPPILRVEILEAGGQAGQLAVALIGVRRHLDRGGRAPLELLEAAAVAAGLGELVEAPLGVLDLARGGAKSTGASKATLTMSSPMPIRSRRIARS